MGTSPALLVCSWLMWAVAQGNIEVFQPSELAQVYEYSSALPKDEGSEVSH
jgi:hypothetical protein